jgi:hypothetical protein
MGLRWGDIEEIRELHLGHRQGNSKKGGGGLKVLIFHYAPNPRSPEQKIAHFFESRTAKLRET